MRRVFVDTSAILALLVPTDAAHSRARRAFDGLRSDRSVLLTTSYVLVETYALLGRRTGREGALAFREAFAPLLDVAWVDRGVHEKGLDLWLERGRSGWSLVDAVSLVAIPNLAIDEIYAYDEHHRDAGLPFVE